MEFADVVRHRRMVRNYDPARPVPPELIDKLLDYAIRAPSAGFSQGWGFLVLTSEADRELFWQVSSPPEGGPPDSWLAGMRRAPAIVVALSNKEIYLDRYAAADKGWTDQDETRWPVPYWDIDTGMAAMIALLSAVEHGLGACFFGVPGERWAALRAAFGVPERLRPIGVISLGYPAQDRRSPSLKRGQRPQVEVVSYGSFAGSAAT